MLPLFLLLMSDPAASVPPVIQTTAPPTPEASAAIVAGLAAHARQATCTRGLEQIERGPARNDGAGANGLRGNLLYSETSEVRLYLLLERTVEGCSVPISYDAPRNQGGMIRNLGETSETSPIH